MDDIEAQGRGSRHSFNSGASSRVQPWGPVKKKSHRCCLPGTPAVRAKRTLCTRARTEARRMRGMGGVSVKVHGRKSEGRGAAQGRALALTKSEGSGSPDGGSSVVARLPLVPDCLAAAPSSPRYPRGSSYTPDSLRRAPRTASAFWVTPASAVATNSAGALRPNRLSHSHRRLVTAEQNLLLLRFVYLVKPVPRALGALQ